MSSQFSGSGSVASAGFEHSLSGISVSSRIEMRPLATTESCSQISNFPLPGDTVTPNFTVPFTRIHALPVNHYIPGSYILESNIRSRSSCSVFEQTKYNVQKQTIYQQMYSCTSSTIFSWCQFNPNRCKHSNSMSLYFLTYSPSTWTYTNCKNVKIHRCYNITLSRLTTRR